MLNIAILLILAVASGVGYQLFIAPRRWMKKYGDGLYNPVVKFNKKNLGIKKDQSLMAGLDKFVL